MASAIPSKQFQVRVADRETGAEKYLTINAASADEAKRIAMDAGWLVAEATVAAIPPKGPSRRLNRAIAWGAGAIIVSVLAVEFWAVGSRFTGQRQNLDTKTPFATSPLARLSVSYNEVRDITTVELYLYFASDKSTFEGCEQVLILIASPQGRPSWPTTQHTSCAFALHLKCSSGIEDQRPFPLYWLVDGRRFTSNLWETPYGTVIGHVDIQDLRQIALARSAVFQVGEGEHVFTLNADDQGKVAEFLKYLMPK